MNALAVDGEASRREAARNRRVFVEVNNAVLREEDRVVSVAAETIRAEIEDAELVRAAASDLDCACARDSVDRNVCTAHAAEGRMFARRR